MAKKNRETWLTQGLTALIPVFKSAGYEIPKNIRITCGWPSKSAGRSSKRRIGECWDGKASADGTIEIIVSMVLDEPVHVLDVLTHEIVHAVVGNEHGHKGPFRKCALAVGLTGKMTATVAGDDLTAKLKTISKRLGKFPHATIDFDSRKRQTSRMLKVECDAPDCGMIFRTTEKWLTQAVDGLSCPSCQGETTLG